MTEAGTSRAAQVKFDSFTALSAHIREAYGVKLFSGRGINVRRAAHLCVLRSVVGVPFYRDEFLANGDVKYTFAGRSGNQSREFADNRALVNPDFRLLLYVSGPGFLQEFKGEYVRVPDSIEEMQHPGVDGALRTIYRITLRKAPQDGAV